MPATPWGFCGMSVIAHSPTVGQVRDKGTTCRVAKLATILVSKDYSGRGDIDTHGRISIARLRAAFRTVDLPLEK
jgi:hypothetical protein